MLGGRVCFGRTLLAKVRESRSREKKRQTNRGSGNPASTLKWNSKRQHEGVGTQKKKNNIKYAKTDDLLGKKGKRKR